MKGVILQRTDARLVDVAHDFPRQDVRASAFWLREVLPYFPSAVHLVVVDPGVGTDRDALVLRTGDHALVGPDNGVLAPVARTLGPDDSFEAFIIDSDDPESSTFHGRDVFAPAAADIHEVSVDSFHESDQFSSTENVVDLQFPDPTLTGDTATGTVLVVDGFGNVITNIPGTVLDSKFGGDVTIHGESVPARRTYATVDPGDRLVTVGSHGNVELAVNQGRGNEAFDLSTGDEIVLSF